jgi:hypothetical protein
MLTCFRTRILFVWVFLMGSCFCQTITPDVVPLLHSKTVLLIVEARINGTGPYRFVVDTGTNITLIESSLFHQLGLEDRGATSAKVVDGMALGRLARAREISIGSQAVRNLEVLEVDGIKRPDLGRSVRGVLGENFLSHFDLLIDNRHHRLLLDSGQTLSTSVSGEHVPLSMTAMSHGMTVINRPWIRTSIPSFGTQSLRLLLDSGGESVYVPYRIGNLEDMDPAVPISKILLSKGKGNSTCGRLKEGVRLGESNRMRIIRINSCAETGDDPSDHDGILPTFIFQRVFISHTQGFVIFDPADSDSRRHTP